MAESDVIKRKKAVVRMRAWRLANPERHREAQQRCREQSKEKYALATRAWTEANLDQVREYRRFWSLANKYGVTREEYIALLETQGGLCAICGVAQSDQPAKNFLVDHDHTTGAVRGLLCRRCNSGLGQFGDDPALLIRALEYMKEASK